MWYNQLLMRCGRTIYGHHETLNRFIDHHSDTPAMPAAWSCFGGKVYNDYQAKKKKRSQLTASVLHSYAQVLFGMLSKLVSRCKGWEAFSQDVERLAMNMENYSVHLDKQAALANKKQSLDHAVRPLDKWSGVEI